MRPPRFAPVLLGLIAALSSCSKTEMPPPVVAAPPPPPSVEIVKAQERSRHFMAVSKQLELGGTLYGYVDIDGDDRKVGDKISSLLKVFASDNPALAMGANQDYTAIFQALGFDDVKAIGVSSVPDGTGFFRNRMFLYTPAGRTGLLAAGGGTPGKFPHLALAGADTDFYFDSDIDAPAIYAAIQKVARQVAGQTGANALETQLEKAGTAASLSILGLFQNLKGNLAVVGRISDTETTTIPRAGQDSLVIPKVEIAACLDGIGSILEPALAHSDKFKADTSGAVHYYSEIAEGKQGMGVHVAIDGSTVYFATTRSYLDTVMKKPDSLREDPTFKNALAHVGAEGNGLSYISPHFYKSLKAAAARNQTGPFGKFVAAFGAGLPAEDRPGISVRTNLPDGILVTSYLDRSLKPVLALVTIYNPVTLGLIAGVTAQQRMMKANAAVAASRNSFAPPPTVQPLTPDATVRRNLRLLYTLGAIHARKANDTRADFADIVGPDKPIKALPAVEGEDYSSLVIHVGEPLRVTVAGGRVIEYIPPAPRKPVASKTDAPSPTPPNP